MKNQLTLGLLVLCLALTGCAAPHVGETEMPRSDVIALPAETPSAVPAQAEETPVPEVKSVGEIAYRPEVVPSAFQNSAEFSAPLYVMLVGSIRQGSEQADMSTLAVDDAQFEGVRSFLLSRNPWGTLTDITHDDQGKITISYSTKDVQERADEAKKFDQAAADVLKSVVPAQSNQISAAIALYKYIAQTVECDYDAEDGGLYAALVKGKGVDSTFAYAYSFLLDQIGVENTVVFSEDASHAWNVLTLNGQSFHCDPQYEAGLNNGQALNYFGLSDGDLAQKNGWNTWISENRALLNCDADMLSAVQKAPFADVDAAGNAVFYSEMEGRSGIFRVDLSTGDVLEVMQAQPDALAVLGDNVYYFSAEEGLIRRYRTTDGDVRPALEGIKILSMRRVADELRYVQDNPEQTENAISLD